MYKGKSALYVTKYSELGCSDVFGVKESSGILRAKTRSGEEEKLLCRPGPAPQTSHAVSVSLCFPSALSVQFKAPTGRVRRVLEAPYVILLLVKIKRDKEIRGKNEFCRS